MKNLDRNKTSIPPQVQGAYQQGKLRQDLESAQNENFRLQEEKEELVELVQVERTEKLTFQERLEQAMQELAASQVEQEQVIRSLEASQEERDRAIASRNSLIGRIGGLTSSNNRLREKLESNNRLREKLEKLETENQALRRFNQIAMEQVVAANQNREAIQSEYQKFQEAYPRIEAMQAEYRRFQDAYPKIKAGYQKLKSAYQDLKAEQDHKQARIDTLQTNFERLKAGYKKLKAEYEALSLRYDQHLTTLLHTYQNLDELERSQLPFGLKQQLDQLESDSESSYATEHRR